MTNPNRAYARRLGEVLRHFHLKSVRKFWLSLGEGDVKRARWQDDAGAERLVSYPSAKKYHNLQDPIDPPAYYLARVSQVYGVRLDWLLREQGPMIEQERRVEEGQQLMADVLRIVHRELGSLAPFGMIAEEVSKAITPAVLQAASWRSAVGGDEVEDVRERHLNAAGAVGRAVLAPLKELGLIPDSWPEAVKAQYILHAIAGLQVPLDLDVEAALAARRVAESQLKREEVTDGK